MREAARPYLNVVNNKKAGKDRKALAEIYLQRPYEYACEINAVNEQMQRYVLFTKKFPNSLFIPEALLETASLYTYLLGCNNTDNELKELFDKIENIYKIISITHKDKECSKAAKQIHDTLATYRRNEKKIDYFKICREYKIDEMNELLPNQIPLCSK